MRCIPAGDGRVRAKEAEEDTMGVFNVKVRMKNLLNEYLPEGDRGEEVECEMMVDTGAVELALPANIVERLRLKPLGVVRVYAADGGEHERRVCGFVELEAQGRTCHVRAIELPRGAEPLLGAIPLEEMDWHVSARGKKLLPNPKSPEKPLLPLCRSRGREPCGSRVGKARRLSRQVSAPVGPLQRRDAMEIGDSFKDVMNGFLDSARTEEQLTLFLLIATMAWNLSVHPQEEWPELLGAFIERFGCPSFEFGGQSIDTSKKIVELCARKTRMYPDLKHLIRELEVEDHKDGLKYSVVRFE